MSFCHEIVLDHPGLEAVRFLVCRPAMSSNGDLESSFLQNMVSISRHPSGRPLTTTLAEVSRQAGCDVVVVIRNPDLVLDSELPERVATALKHLPEAGSWAMAGSGGLGLSDERHLSLYASENPAIPSTGGPQPLVDLMPDLTLVNAAHAAEVLGTEPAPMDTALETVLIVEGYLKGRVSVFLPRLTAGIYGDLQRRDLPRFRQELEQRFAERLAGQTIPSLAGGIALEGSRTSGIAAALDETTTLAIHNHCRAPGISIVTRTRFDRPHLLRRLLTSISRARPTHMPIEIVLSSDADPAACTVAVDRLELDFPHLTLRLQHNAPSGPSRVNNLIEGVKAAQLEYVTIIDDDDYLDIFAFDHITSAFFMGNRPIVVTTSEAHNEVWENTDTTNPVLVRSEPAVTYPAHRWQQMFDGVNKLPVCAIIAPRAFLCQRLEAAPLTHDLSEDYALFLMLLTAADLPEIEAVTSVFVHISLRGEENSVGMHDRRPWVRDIAGHLTTITGANSVAGPGLWAMLKAGQKTEQHTVKTREIDDLRAALCAREREIRVLQTEARQLRAILENQRENVA